MPRLERPLRQCAIECLPPRSPVVAAILRVEATRQLEATRLAGDLRADDLIAYRQILEACR